MTIYKGFSSLHKYKNFKLTDYELVKQDLLNQLNTRRGERVMNPEYGTIIWSLLFEPMTEQIKTAINKDLYRVIKSDPRLVIDKVTITEYLQGIRLEFDLSIVGSDLTQRLAVEFDKRLSAS